MAQGHSNIRLDEIKAHPNKEIEGALIPMEGGKDVYSVKELPPLALRKNEWRTIGDRMDWWKSTDKGGGTLWIEFHDRGGRVHVEDLSFEGIHAAKYQCQQMLEELEEAQEKLDAAEVEENESDEG